jgi:hypothetical protein
MNNVCKNEVGNEDRPAGIAGKLSTT